MMSKRIAILMTAACVLVVFTALTQSSAVRNMYFALTFERTLDRYAQTDSTVTDVTASVDALGRDASLLSAFFGLDNTIPGQARFIVCEGAPGNDGMPVVFSHEVDINTVEPGDFSVTTVSGAPGEVGCLTLAPADDAGELRTVLLIGQFGEIDNQPARVEIVGNLLSKDGAVNFKGLSIEVTPLEAGPGLVLAELVAESEWYLGFEGTGIPFGGGTGCPDGTRQIVRATWNGGITKLDGVEVDDIERELYRIVFTREDQTTYEASPFALGDLRDGDNNHKLCLDTVDRPVSVSFPAGYLTDPRNDLNGPTSVELRQ